METIEVVPSHGTWDPPDAMQWLPPRGRGQGTRHPSGAPPSPAPPPRASAGAGPGQDPPPVSRAALPPGGFPATRKSTRGASRGLMGRHTQHRDNRHQLTGTTVTCTQRRCGRWSPPPPLPPPPPPAARPEPTQPGLHGQQGHGPELSAVWRERLRMDLCPANLGPGKGRPGD